MNAKQASKCKTMIETFKTMINNEISIKNKITIRRKKGKKKPNEI